MSHLSQKLLILRKSIALNRRLHLHFENLEAQRRRLLDRVEGHPAEAFHHSEPGKWSMCQVLAHLINAERLSVRYINKKILGIHEAKNTGWVEEGKMILLKISQRLPFKFKAPAAVVISTPQYANLHELMTDWDLERQELKQLLEKFDESQLRRKVYRHVVVGILNIEQALTFFREHFIHHLPQIKRLL